MYREFFTDAICWVIVVLAVIGCSLVFFVLLPDMPLRRHGAFAFGVAGVAVLVFGLMRVREEGDDGEA